MYLPVSVVKPELLQLQQPSYLRLWPMYGAQPVVNECIVSCFCLFLQVFHCWFASLARQLCRQASWPYAPTHDIQTSRSGQNSTDHAASEYLLAPPTSRAGQVLCRTSSGQLWPGSENCLPWWAFSVSGAAELGPFLWLLTCPPIR